MTAGELCSIGCSPVDRVVQQKVVWVGVLVNDGLGDKFREWASAGNGV